MNLAERCVAANPYELDLTPIDYDAVKGGIRWDIVGDLIGALVIEPHKDLVDTWKAINESEDLEKRAAAIQILGQVPITEAEALELSQGDWQKPDFRNQKLKEWRAFAKEKFREAKKAVK